MSKQITVTVTLDDDQPETTTFAPELTMIDGKPHCTSLQVAEHFGKEHKHVMRDIETTITQVIETSDKPKSGLTENLFKKDEYTITNNFGAKVKKPMYYLSEQGFTLLVMGYTGKKAMEYKLKYMEAFEKMREAVKTMASASEFEPEFITDSQYNELIRDVNRICHGFHCKEKAQNWVLNTLRFAFNIGNVKELPAGNFGKAKEILAASKASATEVLSLRVELEEYIIKNYLCMGIPYTGNLRVKHKQTFGERLPRNPNWQEVAMRLEMAA